MPRSSPSISRAARTPNVSQMRSSVLIVIGLPASICCQWRAENPNPIMSSCVYPLDSRNFLTRWPRVRKNCRSSTTPEFVGDRWRQHHEQISGNGCAYVQCVPAINCAGRLRGQTLVSMKDHRLPHSSIFIGRGSPLTSRAKGMFNARVMRRSVFMVTGLPFSICCQWRDEKPKEIMSSWV
jgi:hypothetical protein